jgi:hypothetical protein
MRWWEAFDAFEKAFAPIAARPSYRANFRFTIVRQTSHRIVVAADGEDEARTIAFAEARRSRWPLWLLPLEVLAHERLTEGCRVTAVERLPPPQPPDDFIWPIMP